MKSIKQVLMWITTIFVPVILILMTIRLLLTPLYIQIEYRLPGFPEDSFGFSFEERLYWANVSRIYLLNNESIDFLGEQQLNENTPLYNQRELQHMLDVKVVIKSAMYVLLGSIVFEIGWGYWSIRAGKASDYRKAMVIAILFYLAMNFSSLFTNFHRIFFEGDTWLFRYSDTLIRLFPIQFWRDAFIWIAVVTLLVGCCIGYFVPKKTK